jgi:hypothetical protein
VDRQRALLNPIPVPPAESCRRHRPFTPGTWDAGVEGRHGAQPAGRISTMLIRVRVL